MGEKPLKKCGKSERNFLFIMRRDLSGHSWEVSSNFNNGKER